MIDVYGIKNCSTVKAARDWLDAQGIDYRFHDFKLEGLDAATAARWMAEIGRDTVVNRRGTTWRKLTPEQQAVAGDEDAVALVVAQPSLVKRPVFDTGSALFVGFGEEQRQALLAK
ncbi:MAG: Spx/MgsR family RNA polymerase-binding regulatory protein [Alphaproteobacteria bacterium]|nr:Spx/MgsR family RNA polymerase-binding regulatory protein [Alphaproteobacteria bacterium]